MSRPHHALLSATTAGCGYKDWPGLSAMHDGHLRSAAFGGEVAHHFAYEGFSKNSAGHYSEERRQYCVHQQSRKICQIGVFFWHASMHWLRRGKAGLHSAVLVAALRPRIHWVAVVIACSDVN